MRGMSVKSRKNPSVICSAEIKQDVEFVLQYKNLGSVIDIFNVNAVCRTAHQHVVRFYVSVVQIQGIRPAGGAGLSKG